jgi:DNA-binding protein YbaB
MFDTDPDQMQQRVSQWAQGFADMAAKAKVMRALVEQIQASASSPDGAVRVTVDSHGVLTDLAFTDAIRDMRPPELAAQVMACLRRAQQQLAPKVREAMLATVGGEQQLVANVVSSYRERFGRTSAQQIPGCCDWAQSTRRRRPACIAARHAPSRQMRSTSPTAVT